MDQKNELKILFWSQNYFFVLFFFSKAAGDATSRQTNAAGSAVGHAFSRRKTTEVTAHTLIYVSQCEMRHSNPVPQHEVFLAPFPVLSLFVRHSCFACLLPLSIALFDVELRFSSLLRRLFSRSLSISLSLLYMFVDIFINWVCVLSYTSSSKLL